VDDGDAAARVRTRRGLDRDPEISGFFFRFPSTTVPMLIVRPAALFEHAPPE